MSNVSVIQGVQKYGIRNFFYRVLLRIIPNNLKFPYYFYRKIVFGYAIVNLNGVKLRVDLKNDDGLSRELVIFGKRERLTMDYLLNSNILKEGDTALDVGGNIGYYALPESNLVGRTGKVYAVEPVLSNYTLLQKNVELNKMQNISLHQMAMGDKEGMVPIYVRTKKNLSSLTQLSSDESGGVLRKEEVPMTTVDLFVEKVIGKTPTLIRMDVEGYEASILEGMHNTLKGGATLLIEFHPMFLKDVQKERIIELLEQFNYTKVVVTVNPKAKMNSILRYLNNKIGLDSRKDGLTKEGNLDYFKEMLYTSPRVFNAFLSQETK